MQLLIRTLILSLFIPICHAEIYKWTDENGRVHYGERPNNPNTEKIEIKSTAPKPDAEVDSDRKEKQRKLLEAFEEERAEKKQKKAETDKQKREMKKKCAELKDYYKSIKEANILYDLDEQGNRRFLEEEEHKKQIADVEDAMKKHCQ